MDLRESGVSDNDAGERREAEAQATAADEGIASEGLNSTPYVKIRWANDKEDIALFDTGAQWSLKCEGLLTAEERRSMQSSSLSGRGVSGEKIPVVGEIWRSVGIGGLTFENQRFIVVERMICQIILGIDFWSRISNLSFDFNRSVMRMNGGGEEINLLQHPSMGSMAGVEGECEGEDTKKNWVEVVVDEEIRIPAKSEMFVNCYVPGMEAGR